MDILLPAPGIIVFDSELDPDDLPEFGDHTAVVGCRQFSEAALVRARNRGMSVYPMRLLVEDLCSACDVLMELALTWSKAHVLIRGRVLDPAFARSESLSHGGLQTRELFYFIERVKLLRNYAGGKVECEDGVLREQLERALRK